MKKWILLPVVALCVLLGMHFNHRTFFPTAQLTPADHEQMRKEAETFLKNMPAGLQDRQTAAITQAINGDNQALQAVRNARNQAPTLSPNVETRQISHTLRLYEPKEVYHPLPLLVYFHGGGWTFGSINSCGRFCDALAATGKVKVLAVDYRLAPEHPFPQGLEDCQSAVIYAHTHAEQWNVLPQRISVGGDSSGGNLALATALSEHCKQMIHSIVAFYPVTKAYDDQSASWKAYGTNHALDASIMNEFNRAYVGKVPSEQKLVNIGDNSTQTLQQLPPTLLIAAGKDILRDQGLELAEKAGEKVIKRIEFPEAVHLFITVPGQEKAFREAVRLTEAFLSSI